MKKERILGLDIIKAVAALFVVSIHQIGQTHAMAMDLNDARSFLIILFRYTVMSCVPLFIMATGYFQCRKTPDKRFYKGIIPVIVTYLFTTAVCVIVQFAQGDTAPWDKVIVRTLNFTQNGYAWYVEMYITLYLLIPFINMALGKTKKQRLLLIGLLFLSTIAPSIPIAFSTDRYWLDLFPNYWDICYPLFYYAVGAYIREYSPKMNKGVNILLFIAAMLLPTVTEFVQAGGGEFVDYVFNGFNSFSACLIAVLIFMLFYDVNVKIIPARTFIISVSNCTLELYLFSFSVELILYPWFEKHFGEYFPMRLWVMIAAVFISSYILALAAKAIFAMFKRAKNTVTTRQISVSR